MDGLQIFTHSVRQVFGNLNAALRISGLLFLVQLGAAYIFGRSMMGPGEPMREQMMRGDFPIGGLLIFILLALVTGLWIAVAWHRHVLGGEAPGAVLPPFNGDRMLAYFGYSLLIAVILIPLALVLGFVASWFVGPMMQSGRIVLGLIVVGLVVYLPMLVVAFRLSVALPAAALGKPLGIGGAWNKTKGTTGTMVLLAVLAVVFAVVIDLPAGYVFPANSILSLIWSAAAQWVALMVGVSILTTLYGHFVEGRALV